MIKKLLNKKYARIGIVLLVLLLIFLVIGLFISKPSGNRGMKEKKAVPVFLAEVDLGEIRSALFYPAELHAEEEVKVFSVASGKIIKYNYREGEHVRKGSVLATLDRQEIWDDYMPVTVRAPISGIVARNYLDKGEFATDTTVISLIVGGSGITGTIKVTDSELPLVKVGMKAELVVSSVSDKVFVGEVSEVSPILNTTTRTARAEVLFKDDAASLVAGMFGDVVVITEEKGDVIVIPTKALLFEEEGRNGPYCFVVDEDRAKKRSLTLGIINEDSVEVVSGLKVGENVVVIGKEGLKENAPVVVTEDF